MIFDETHRFACDDDTPDLPPLPSTASAGDGAADAVNKGMGPAAGGDEVNRTGNGRSKGGRNDIDQALSLLQLSGGSGGVPQVRFMLSWISSSVFFVCSNRFVVGVQIS